MTALLLSFTACLATDNRVSRSSCEPEDTASMRFYGKLFRVLPPFQNTIFNES